MTEPLVSVNIVNWNGGQLFNRCLESVFAQELADELEVVVVDNGSEDDSLACLERFKDIKLIRNETNVGFSKAHNQAIRASSGRFVMPLNFDVILSPNFIAEMVKAALQGDRIGMVSGKLYKGTDGKRTCFIDSTGMIMVNYFSAPRGENEEDSGQYDMSECRSIFGPCGAAPLYRREMLEDIKYGQEYFDEDFVNYVEDVDLSWRAQLRGWTAVYTPSAVAYHERGATRKHNADEQAEYYIRGYRNRYLAIYKNASKYELATIFHKLLIREIFFLIGGAKTAVTLRMKARSLKGAIGYRKVFKRKRKYVQESRVIPSRMIMPFFAFDTFNVVAFVIGKSKHYFLGLPRKHILEPSKRYIHDQLCRFSLGRAFVRRLKLIKEAVFKS